MERLIVYQFVVTRTYEDTPDYMVFESGKFNRPLLILSELEATALRDNLDAALKSRPHQTSKRQQSKQKK